MAADGSLNFDTSIDTKGFNSGVKSIDSSLGGLKSALGKVAVAAAAAFSVGAIVQFGKQAVETASDLQEVQNVVDTAFGSMSDKMEELAETSITQFGISRLAAKRTGSTFMAMASGMGIAQDAASDMAIALTGLSADMASFYNVEQDVASTALKSVFTGETETLKQFGIVMTEANLEAYALSQGITKSVSAMSQAEKVQLRYSYVMQQTALAQGDFAKTSSSWANQTRILSEQWKEFSSTVGTLLMNVVLPAVKMLNDAMSQLIARTKAAVQTIADVFGIETQSSSPVGLLTDDTASLALNASTAADSYSDMADSAKKAQKANEKSLASFDKITKLSGSDSADSGEASGASPTVSGNTPIGAEIDTSAASEKLNSFFENAKSSFGIFKKYINENFGGIFSDIWSGLKSEGEELSMTFSGISDDLQSLTEPLKQYLTGDFAVCLQTAATVGGGILVGLFDSFNKVFSDIWSIAVYPMLAKLITTGLPTLAQFSTQALLTLGTLFDNVKQNFDMLWEDIAVPILSLLSQIWSDCWDSISKAWNKWGKPVFEKIRTAINNTGKLVRKVWKKYLKPVWDKITDGLGGLWKDHIKPVMDKFLDFTGKITDAALDIYNEFILPVANWFADTFGPAISRVLGFVSDRFFAAAGAFYDAIGGIIDALSGLIDFVMGVFSGDWERAWSGIKDFFGGIWDSLVSIVSVPIEGIADLFSWLWDEICSIYGSVGDWFSEKFGAAKKAVTDAFGSIGGWFQNRWNDIKAVFANVKKWFGEKFTGAWDRIKSAFGSIKSWFGNRWQDVKDVFSGVGDWFKEKFSGAWKNIKSVFSWNNVMEHFSTVWRTITDIFSSVGTWFGEKFSGAWDKIKEAFSGVKDFFEGIWETVTDAAKSGLNAVIDKINSAISKVNGISFDFANPLSGDNVHIGFDIPEIPKLAQGTVVPANYGEFLAVLGDNRRETEVVSPLSTIERAVENVLSRRGNGGEDINLTLNLDGKTIYKNVVRRNNESVRMTGKNPLIPKGVTV